MKNKYDEIVYSPYFLLKSSFSAAIFPSKVVIVVAVLSLSSEMLSSIFIVSIVSSRSS